MGKRARPAARIVEESSSIGVIKTHATRTLVYCIISCTHGCLQLKIREKEVDLLCVKGGKDGKALLIFFITTWHPRSLFN